MDHCERVKRKTNPIETANIFSLLSFAYTGGLFKRGLKKDLEEENLYEVLKQANSKKCGDKLEQRWLLEKKKNDKVSIIYILWKCFGFRYLMFGVIELTWRITLSVTEPLTISNLIAYFTPGQTEITRNMAYCYAAFILLLNIVKGLYNQNSMLFVERLAIEIKTSLSSLVYRKALKLTPSALLEISLGNVITLITKDVHSFEQSIWMVIDFWVSMIRSCVLCYLLYSRIGTISFIGVGILLSIIPVQIFVGKLVSRLRLSAGAKTDERLQVTQETLSTMRIIKMYTWEQFFGDRITKARDVEMKKLSLGFYLRVLIVIIGTVFVKIGFYVIVMSNIWFGNSINAKKLYYIVSIFRELRSCIGIVIPWGLGIAAECYSSIKRLDRVLSGDELKPKTISEDPTVRPMIELTDVVVHINDEEILKKVNFKLNAKLTLITGTVGSGKSSLLKTMLQDYPLTSGTLVSRGRISYASQDPWLFPSSIKQNITFGEEYDERRYQEVVRVCALQYDFNLFDKGDETIVTDKGLNLSKGQQARVNLARAVYKESEIYLLDDSLTALDTHVQDFIFHECIKTFLKDKLVLLVSQTANHIQEADIVVIMDHGKIIDCGPPDRHIIEEVQELVVEDDDLEKEVIDGFKHDKHGDEEEEDEKSKLLETDQVTGRKKVYGEVKKTGKVELKTYLNYFMFGGGIFLMCINVVLFGLTQTSESSSEILLSKWIDVQHTVITLKENMAIENEVERNSPPGSSNDTNFNETFNLITEAQSSFNSTTNNASTYEKLFDEATAKEQFTIRMYSIVMISFIVFAFIESYAIFDYCRRASVNIHKSMVKNIMNATMSFFDTHFIGNILNRFSQDINNVDEQFPFTLRAFLKQAFAVLGVIVVLSLVNANCLIYVGPFFVATYTLRAIYMPTGRSLKRLEAATRSPMIGHLNASLEGLTTIRAYKAQKILIDEFDRHQDLYTSAHFAALTASRAFGFMVDFLCNILISCVVVRFIFIDTDTSAGNVGLALTQVYQMAGMVQWGVRQWADLENIMTSVERLLEYTEIKPETKEGTEIKGWPSKGAIQYEKVYLSYNQTDVVLKNLNFEVKPGQKIGVVGRTGAGKTSIISTLFRLYDVDGKISIDDVNTKSLHLKFLRRSIGLIPQDPVMFSGTIRTNLDPLNEFKDEELWRVIDTVGLKPLVESLNSPISNTASQFSSGQKQLVCLARATLRKTKILILDEATANMDHGTDVMLNETISQIFTNCTIFVIAHRLHSILMCDKVMVMDRGEVKEFDEPMTLLQSKSGIFYKMVEQAGLLDYTN